MTNQAFRTVLIGFGQVAEGYSEDPLFAGIWKYPTHAQVLADHPGFQWDAVVDISETALAKARDKWGVPLTAASVSELPVDFHPEVAILATPPSGRKEIIEALPGLRAVVVEKPLGLTAEDSEAFLDVCKQRNILVQVNLYRRADKVYQSLAAGRLDELVGKPQGAFAVYGNGISNNGVHLIDLIRFLLGEIVSVQALPWEKPMLAGPIPGDVNISAVVRLQNGAPVSLFPVRFDYYRENSLDIWGEKGRLTCFLEGLVNTYYPVRPNRCMQGEKEVAVDEGTDLGSGVSDAFYRLYDDILMALREGTTLCSPPEHALQAELVIERILESADLGGRPLNIKKEMQGL